MTKTDVVHRWQSKHVAQSYDAERFQGLFGRVYHRLQCGALRKCLRQLAHKSHIADIPSGTGRMLPILLECASSVIACDVSEAMLVEARRRVSEHGPVDFLLCDARNLPLDNASVDGVVSIRFGMHLEPAEREAILREFARVTREWVVMEYGRDSTWHAARRLMRSILLAILRRRRLYPKSTPRRQILREAKAAGLEVRRWCWSARGLSESVFVVMKKANRSVHGQ